MFSDLLDRCAQRKKNRNSKAKLPHELVLSNSGASRPRRVKIFPNLSRLSSRFRELRVPGQITESIPLRSPRLRSRRKIGAVICPGALRMSVGEPGRGWLRRESRVLVRQGHTARSDRSRFDQVRPYIQGICGSPKSIRESGIVTAWGSCRTGQRWKCNHKKGTLQYRALPGVRGNGMASRTLARPVT
jgi:hypothetical protein